MPSPCLAGTGGRPLEPCPSCLEGILLYPVLFPILTAPELLRTPSEASHFLFFCFSFTWHLLIHPLPASSSTRSSVSSPAELLQDFPPGALSPKCVNTFTCCLFTVCLLFRMSDSMSSRAQLSSSVEQCRDPPASGVGMHPVRGLLKTS